MEGSSYDIWLVKEASTNVIVLPDRERLQLIETLSKMPVRKKNPTSTKKELVKVM